MIMRLSIVTTLYNSSPFIEEFHRRATAAAESITSDFEVVMVNDGSPDDSLEQAIALHTSDDRVVLVDLSRNFGHHRAMMTGLAYARGELVFLIDSDLEEDPELLRPFLATMEREKCDVVYGVQAKRRGNAFETLSGMTFYWIMSRLGGIEIPKNVTTVRLMTRRYVRSLIRHREREMIISGLWVITGFHQVAQKIEKKRSNRRSNYSLLAKFRIAIDLVTAFSDSLLYGVFCAGLAISVAALFVMIYFVAQYLITGHVLAGWTSIIASIWMFGGLSILLIGLIGIYIARIFNETKHRPYTIVREVYRTGSSSHRKLP
jgi:putative glycosyltransferase